MGIKMGCGGRQRPGDRESSPMTTAMKRGPPVGRRISHIVVVIDGEVNCAATENKNNNCVSVKNKSALYQENLIFCCRYRAVNCVVTENKYNNCVSVKNKSASFQEKSGIPLLPLSSRKLRSDRK
jgi:hypothetical protein